jgi:hypothetical protein
MFKEMQIVTHGSGYYPDEVPGIYRACLRLLAGSSSCTAPLEILENVQLLVTTRDKAGVTATRTISDFRLLALPDAAVHSLLVPSDCREVSISISAQVTCVARGDNKAEVKQDLLITETMAVNEAEGGCAVGDIYLTRIAGGDFAAQVLGRCGEGLAAVPLRVALEHWAWNTQLAFEVRTDKFGVCRLPWGIPCLYLPCTTARLYL